MYEQVQAQIPRPEASTMQDAVRRLDREYGFKLSDEEIEIIVKQAEAAHRLFRPLFEVDLAGIMPIVKIDKRVGKTKKAKK
jgi:hypothetical protein